MEVVNLINNINIEFTEFLATSWFGKLIVALNFHSYQVSGYNDMLQLELFPQWMFLPQTAYLLIITACTTLFAGCIILVRRWHGKGNRFCLFKCIDFCKKKTFQLLHLGNNRRVWSVHDSGSATKLYSTAEKCSERSNHFPGRSGIPDRVGRGKW